MMFIQCLFKGIGDGDSMRIAVCGCAKVVGHWQEEQGVWDDNPYLLFAWLAIAPHSRYFQEFQFNEQKTLKAHWIYLNIRNMYVYTKRAFPFPKVKDNKKKSQSFSDITHVYSTGKRYISRILFFTRCCIPRLYLPNKLWKHLSEEI